MATANGQAGKLTEADVRGKRVLVYSLGIEGRDLARWLLANGASVTVSDTRTDAQLAASGATAPEGVTVKVSMLHGGHPWRADLSGPLYEAAGRALTAAFGARPNG